MRIENPEERRSWASYPPGATPPTIMVVLSIVMALLLLAIGAALIALPRSRGLSALAAAVAAISSLWLLVLTLRAVRTEKPVRLPSPPAAPEKPASSPKPSSTGGDAALDLALSLEREAAVERARRLTEASFLAGSNAVVNARAVLRGLEDCKGRLSESSHRLETGGEDVSAAPVARAFESILTDLEQLAACARLIRPMAGAAAIEAARGSAAETTSRFGSPSAFHPPNNSLFVVALKLGELAAELEHGLLGVISEVRVLRRARLTRPSLNGKPGQRRSASEPPWGRALDRLEAQVVELAKQVAEFTRDAEQLSRELDQLR